LCRFDDLASFRLYATKAFGDVAHGQVDHPDRRQTHVHAARMADSSRRVSIFAEQIVVVVTLTPVLHLDPLHRPVNDLSIEDLSRGGVGNGQVEPTYAPNVRRRVGPCSAVI